MGSDTSVEAGEHRADELRQGPIAAIQTEKVGLPEHHPRHTVLKKDQGAGVV